MDRPKSEMGVVRHSDISSTGEDRGRETSATLRQERSSVCETIMEDILQDGSTTERLLGVVRSYGAARLRCTAYPCVYEGKRHAEADSDGCRIQIAWDNQNTAVRLCS